MDIKIVEYDHSYAAKVAKMWNKSTSNFGRESLKTEEEVINEEENSGNIKLFLAIDDDEVVGYCSFSEYRMDEGASYLPLLSVRPDYHGKKIGKKLILRVMEEAINSEWPRIDLRTWGGNYKAVPLYKKCGFFWEKRNDSVHLMNFIPYVLKTEAIRDYFKIIDWYKDSKREIELIPDGLVKNGFEYYEYIFQKDELNLRLEFERKGRGLRLIETNDYLIKATVEKQQLVFGYDYDISYEIINKTSKPLEISLKGIDDKNIKYSYNENLTVKEKVKVVGRFSVDKIDELIDPLKNHPTVSTIVTINGKEALFKVGIEPIPPINVKFKTPTIKNNKGIKSISYLDIENGFDKDCRVSFKIPSNKDIVFSNENYDLVLKPKQVISLPIEYTLNDFGLYDEIIEFSLLVDNKKSIYNQSISGLFKGDYGKFYGKVNQDYLISNGKYVCIFDYKNKEIHFKDNEVIEESSVILPVKIGMPYSSEFSRLNPDNVDFNIEGDTVSMILSFNSLSFIGINVSIVCKLSSNGLLETFYKVKNNGKKRNNLKLLRSVFQQISDSYIPYNNEILYINGNDGRLLDLYDDKYLDENWIFRSNKEVKTGICWDREDNLKFNRMNLTIENHIPKLDKGSEYTSKSLFISLNHSNYSEFREFALTKNTPNKKEVGIIDITVNNDNPFVKDSYPITIKNNRKTNFTGKLNINGVTKEITNDSETIYSDSLDLYVELDLPDRVLYKECSLFNTNNTKVETYKQVIEGKDVFIVDNGLIKLKASNEFSDGLFSIQYKGDEWLDSTFPTPKQRSWWNPWVGGVKFRPVRMLDGLVLNESIDTEFIELKDNFNNIWTGIKTKLKIINHSDYKGITIENYFLLLPGADVVLSTSRITQNSGKYISNLQFDKRFALKIGNDLSKARFVVETNEQITKYKCDEASNDFKVKGLVKAQSDRDSNMYIYNTNDSYINVGSQNGISGVFIFDKFSLPDNSIKNTANDFIIFSKNNLNKLKFNSLKNIKLLFDDSKI